MAAPRVDVLLPVRCARRTLPSALGDVLAQEGVAVRVIAVVDPGPDGRDDGSTDWLEAAAADEPRLAVRRGPGAGAAAALELALSLAEAELVSHMEADDRCPPDRLARLHGALASGAPDGGAPDGGALDAVTSRVAQFGARTPGMRRYLDWQNGLLTPADMARERFVEIPALHQTGLYRRAALEAAGGYRCLGPWPVDIDFWMRWFERGLRVAKLPRVLYRWRQHPRQSTRGGGQHELAALRACKLAALARLHGPDGREPAPLHLVSTGRTLEAWRDELTAAGLELAGVDTWKPGRPPPTVAPGARALVVYGMQATRERLLAALPEDVRARAIPAA